MQSWPVPELPDLPGTGPVLRIHDTGARQVRPIEPGPTARMYVCGITPYDATHVGHAATYVAFDLIHRLWRDAGHDVHYVQNVTDIDDPLLERANDTGDDWRELADREVEVFRGDMAALRVLPPREYVGAVEAIPLITDLIARLRDKGAAYEVESDLYFPVNADPRFGSLARLDVAEMVRLFGENGGDPDRPGKKDSLDCLLWQSARPGEPAWDSTLGRGRPGWHIECGAISLHYLGMTFDIQGGGRDLVFPHHEMGAAEAHVATGTFPHARAYVHAGMVGLDGEKMSKSLGNLVFVSRLRNEGADPMAVRLALLNHRYRNDWTWTPTDLHTADERLARWREAVQRPSGPPAGTLLEGVRDRLADDLDTPAALTAIDGWADAALAGQGEDTAAPALVRDLADALLGVSLRRHR
ncbi:MAG: cysteine--1-D-myo-inosityl 2-amino-2-deoxy-alpha-D-glucopyranoside ligase [Streptosporangiales bacterium]|nr:cysteine--1-D-myo-inosityl 2-amino-2-deoxy-alpha-D-glucopyranoside ligase [Streptosporangiales bacterium]